MFSLYNRMPINNPEVFVASVCEFLGLPLRRRAAEHRVRSPRTNGFPSSPRESVGLPVADGAIYGACDDLAKPPSFPGPYFVKNRFGAASEGVSEQSLQDDWAGATEVAKTLLGRGMSVLVEAYAPGIDITVPVLGGEQPLTLGIVRPRSDRAGGIITEDLKRDDPLGYEMFDAEPSLQKAVTGDVAALWSAAGPMDYLRLDYRFDPVTGRRTILEFNICCHIGRSGAICLAASQWGWSQADILGHVVEYSLHRQQVDREARRWVR